ncbi:BMP-binding endothelial regulator protein [Aphelenchoides fujianensis]|nr:BMP-binding endothelial regulator protein [Aphelenchoides fujianensis]
MPVSLQRASGNNATGWPAHCSTARPPNKSARRGAAVRNARGSGGTAVFCDFNGRILGVGERFRPDVCTQCTCGNDGRQVCRRFVCPRTCAEGANFHPFGGFSPLTHDLDFASNDHLYVHPTLLPGRQCENDRWSPDACTTCDCRSGQVVCQSQACTPLRCDPDSQQEKILARKCCPVCVEVKRPLTTTLNPPASPLFAQCKLATSGGGQLRTFDGRSVQLQPNAAALKHPSFTLELHNDQEGGVRKLSVELNENNGIRLGVLNFFSKELKYRGRRIKLPLTTRIFSAFRSAAANRTTLNLHLVELKVVWTAGRSVRVFVERKRHFGSLCGLCGNFNDQPADDLLPQFATNTTDDEREFVDSWRVDQDDQCQPSSKVIGKEEAEDGDPTDPPAEVHPTEQIATNTCSRLLSPSNRAERRGFLTQFLKLKRNPLLQSCHSVLGLHSFLRRCAAAVCRCEHERQAEGRPTKAEEMRMRRRRKFVKKRRSPIDSIVIKMKGGRVQKTLRYTTETADEKPPEEPCFCPAMSDYVRECAQRGLLTFGLSNPNDEKTGLVAYRLRFHLNCPVVKLERV